MSYLCKWTDHVMSCAALLHFTELIVFFLMKMYNRCLVSFSNFAIVLINWYQDFVSSNSVSNHTRD